MRKQEASITTRINKWFPAVVPTSSPWEVKHTRGDKTFKMSELKEHQRNWLLACTTAHGATYKIEDAGFHFPPFDVMHYKNTPAYVIVVFPLNVYAIEIRNILDHKKTTLSEDDALRLSLWTLPIARLPK